MAISKRAVYEAATGKCLSCTHPTHFGDCTVVKYHFKRERRPDRVCRCSRPGNNLDHMKAIGQIEEHKKRKWGKYNLRYVKLKGDL
jgi:hypothetical protein